MSPARSRICGIRPAPDLQAFPLESTYPRYRDLFWISSTTYLIGNITGVFSLPQYALLLLGGITLGALVLSRKLHLWSGGIVCICLFAGYF